LRFFEYSSDKKNFYLGYFIRFGSSAGLFTKLITYRLICHVCILLHGSYSIDPDSDQPILNYSDAEIIVDESLENDRYYITPLKNSWKYLNDFANPGPGPSEFEAISTLESNDFKRKFLLSILSELESLREDISDHFVISVNKVKIVSKKDKE